MIRITTVPEKLSVKAEGHANFGKKGQDIEVLRKEFLYLNDSA